MPFCCWGGRNPPQHLLPTTPLSLPGLLEKAWSWQWCSSCCRRLQWREVTGCSSFDVAFGCCFTPCHKGIWSTQCTSILNNQTIRAKSLDPTYQGSWFFGTHSFQTGCQTGICSLQFLGVTTSKTCWKHQLRWIRSPGRQAKKPLREESTPKVVFPYFGTYLDKVYVYIYIHNQIVLDSYHKLINKQQQNTALGSHPCGFYTFLTYLICFCPASIQRHTGGRATTKEGTIPQSSVPWHPISQKQPIGHTGLVGVSEKCLVKKGLMFSGLQMFYPIIY